MGCKVNKLPLLLVLPPQQWLLEGFSSGLVALASYVNRHLPECEIHVLDLSHTSSRNLEIVIQKALAHFNLAPLIGITTTTASYQSSLETAAVCKQFSPDCKIILGGHHTKSQESLILKRHRGVIDFISSGEGEITLLRLLKEYPDVSRIPGLTYLSIDGEVVKNPPAPALEEAELDKISVDFRGLEITALPGKFDHVTYVSARGCPLQCSFCAVANERIRAKTIPCVIEDLRHLSRDLGYTSIAIEDNFFAHSPARSIALCEAITKLQRQERAAFRWDCQTRVESMRRPDILAAMTRANCEAVYLGVEALEEKQLLYLGKTSHPGDYLDLLEQRVIPQLLHSPINCYINLQLGVPGETEADWQKTLARLRRLGQLAYSKDKNILVFPQLFVIYPGTRHYIEGVTQGRFPYDVFESFTAWEYNETPIRRFLGEEFAHGTGGVPEGILVTEHLRSGQNYQVRLESVIRVVQQLRDMDEIPGITVFRYGRYLVRDESAGQVPEEQIIKRLTDIAA
jgi:radical SAM superfamily enzyme YgiQ (UPF0313 family)